MNWLWVPIAVLLIAVLPLVFPDGTWPSRRWWQEGMVLVSAMHITAGVFINDDEPGLHHDYEKWLEQLAPHAPVKQYRKSMSSSSGKPPASLFLHR